MQCDIEAAIMCLIIGAVACSAMFWLPQDTAKDIGLTAVAVIGGALSMRLKTTASTPQPPAQGNPAGGPTMP